MIQFTTATLVQAPTNTRQAVCATIFVRLHRRWKQSQRYLGIAEVSTLLQWKQGESQAQTFKLCHAQVR